MRSSLAIDNTIILLYYTEVFPDIYQNIESKFYTLKVVCYVTFIAYRKYKKNI